MIGSNFTFLIKKTALSQPAIFQRRAEEEIHISYRVQTKFQNLFICLYIAVINASPSYIQRSSNGLLELPPMPSDKNSVPCQLTKDFLSVSCGGPFL